MKAHFSRPIERAPFCIQAVYTHCAALRLQLRQATSVHIVVHSLAVETLTRRSHSRARRCRSRPDGGHSARGSARDVRAAEREHVALMPLPLRQTETECPRGDCARDCPVVKLGRAHYSG